MYKLQITKAEYERLKTALTEFRPNIKLILVECDDALERLGFCKSAPCIVRVDLTEEEMEILLEDLIDLEVSAYNTDDGNNPPKDDPFYILYEKYGWMWGYFYYAELVYD
ncbi:MAG: hypothetical protein IJX98_04030 [Clostridia bacterium]|nr:hypothetical protein [Clostridia bacterium]